VRKEETIRERERERFPHLPATGQREHITVFSQQQGIFELRE